MATRMVTLKLDPGEATLSHVKAKLDLKEGDLDKDFGLVNVSPAENLYAILVDDKTADRLEGHKDVAGSFSNPQIEPFGPPSAEGIRGKQAKS